MEFGRTNNRPAEDDFGQDEGRAVSTGDGAPSALSRARIRRTSQIFTNRISEIMGNIDDDDNFLSSLGTNFDAYSRPHASARGTKRQKRGRPTDKIRIKLTCLDGPHVNRAQKINLSALKEVGLGYPSDEISVTGRVGTEIPLDLDSEQFDQFLRALFPLLGTVPIDLLYATKSKILFPIAERTPMGIKTFFKTNKHVCSVYLRPHVKLTDIPDAVLYAGCKFDSAFASTSTASRPNRPALVTSTRTCTSTISRPSQLSTEDTAPNQSASAIPIYSQPNRPALVMSPNQVPSWDDDDTLPDILPVIRHPIIDTPLSDPASSTSASAIPTSSQPNRPALVMSPNQVPSWDDDDTLPDILPVIRHPIIDTPLSDPASSTGETQFTYEPAGTPTVLLRRPRRGVTSVTQNLMSAVATDRLDGDISSELTPMVPNPDEGQILDVTTHDDADLIAALAESLRSEPEVKSAEDLIASFIMATREPNGDKKQSVIIRRSAVWKSALRATRGTFHFSWIPRVRFAGEEAEDYGGPTREFFRLLMEDILKNSGLFGGHDEKKSFLLDNEAVDSNQYFKAGQFVSWSLLHGGNGLQYLRGEVNKFVELDIKQSTTLMKTETEKDYLETCKELAPWAEMSGCPNLDESKSLDEKLRFVSSLKRHFLIHRVRAGVDQFIKGMDSIGKLFTKYIMRNPSDFKSIMASSDRKLTFEQLSSLFEYEKSDVEGLREMEDNTIYLFEQFLVELENGAAETDITLRNILTFITGADTIPPNGFEKQITIKFFDRENEKDKRLPYASTCALDFFLPRGLDMDKPEEFETQMNLAIKLGLAAGFGKC